MTLTVAVPGSKSMTQRALLIAALGTRACPVRNILECDDSRYLRTILRQLGGKIDERQGELWIHPAESLRTDEPLFCGNAGTAMRFASCLSLLAAGSLRLDGDERMRQRPVTELGDALQRMGIDVRYEMKPGYPPWTLQRRQPAPRSVDVDCSQSSQFGSGLMLVAPRLPEGLTLRFTGARVSRPYLHMTAAMMQSAGIDLDWPDEDRVAIRPGTYRPPTSGLVVEPDWSSAAFIQAAARLAEIDTEIPGLLPLGDSLQGDALFPDLVRQLDRDGPVEIDLSGTPDLVAPLVPLCLFRRQPVTIRGIAHAKIKECDRPAVLSREFTRIGARIAETPDGLRIEPAELPANCDRILEPEDDHRMAMAFALVSLRVPGLGIRNPECVSKSFPDFFTILEPFRRPGKPSERG